MKSVLFILAFASTIQAATVTIPEVDFTYRSLDGAPISSISYGYSVHYQAMTMQPCDDFICLPIPRETEINEGFVRLGLTDAHGEAKSENMSINTMYKRPKKFRVEFFSSEVIVDICQNGNRPFDNDNLYLGLQASPCRISTTNRNEQSVIKLGCHSIYTEQQILEKIESIKSSCHK